MCRAHNLFGPQIPVSTAGFELQVSTIFAVQAILWSLEFVSQINLEHGTIAITIHILPNISKTKGNKAMKFAQLIKYSVRFVFL